MSLTIVHRDDLERTGYWSLVRRSLGITSFGINLVDIPPGDGDPRARRDRPRPGGAVRGPQRRRRCSSSTGRAHPRARRHLRPPRPRAAPHRPQRGRRGRLGADRLGAAHERLRAAWGGRERPASRRRAARRRRQRPELAAYRDMWRRRPPTSPPATASPAARWRAASAWLRRARRRRPILNHALGVGVGRARRRRRPRRIEGFYAAPGRPTGRRSPRRDRRPGRPAAGRAASPARPWMTFHRPAARDAGPATGLRVDGGRRAAGGGVRRHRGRGVRHAARLRGLDGARSSAARAGRACSRSTATRPSGAAALFVDGDAGWFGLGRHPRRAPRQRRPGRAVRGARCAGSRAALGLRDVVTETGAPVGRRGPRGPPTATCCAAASARRSCGRTYASPAA